MDAVRYAELKAKGAVKMMKLGAGHFAISVRKFDSNSGEELEPELQRIKRDQVVEMKKAFAEAMAGCDALLADMDAPEA
jgi:hypothetical protein